MIVQVNGKPLEVDPAATVSRLLAQLGLEGPYALV